jgi:hypothetical protein
MARPRAVGTVVNQGARAPRVLPAIPAFYRRHAEIDRPLANRMREIQTRREKKLRLLKQRFEHRAQASGGEHARLREHHQDGKSANENTGIGRQRAREHEELRQNGSGEQARRNHESKQRRQNESR